MKFTVLLLLKKLGTSTEADIFFIATCLTLPVLR